MIGVANPAFRHAAIRVIGRVFEKRAHDNPIDESIGDAIVAALNDRERSVRIASMQTLGAIGYERAVQALTQQFQYLGRGDAAEAALQAAARIAHPSSVMLFTTGLASKNAVIKAISIEGLARIGDRSRLASIESALKSENDDGVLLAGTFASVVLSNSPIDPLAEGLRKPKLAEPGAPIPDRSGAGPLGGLRAARAGSDELIRAGVADVLGIAGDRRRCRSWSRWSATAIRRSRWRPNARRRAPAGAAPRDA